MIDRKDVQVTSLTVLKKDINYETGKTDNDCSF